MEPEAFSWRTGSLRANAASFFYPVKAIESPAVSSSERGLAAFFRLGEDYEAAQDRAKQLPLGYELNNEPVRVNNWYLRPRRRK